MAGGVRWTEEDLARLVQQQHRVFTEVVAPAARRPHKYHAEPTEVDGHLFPSKREAERYQQLRLLEQGGVIEDLRLQFRFPLQVNNTVLGYWIADFTYSDAESGGCVVEDAKGVRTEIYRWKKRHFEAQHGLQIREV